MARCSIYVANGAQRPRVRACRPGDAGPRYRRKHGHICRDPRGAAVAPRIPGPPPLDDHLGWEVRRPGLGLTIVVGVASGGVGAFVLTRLMTDLPFQVSATDPGVFGTFLFLVVAFPASYVPARLATRIDPMSAPR